MYGVIVVVAIIVSVALVLVVLAQNAKGGGLSSEFGGGGSSRIMDVRRTGDFLENATWGLAIAILVLSLSAHIVNKQPVAQNSSPNLNSTTAPAPAAPLQGLDVLPEAETGGDAGSTGGTEGTEQLQTLPVEGQDQPEGGQ